MRIEAFICEWDSPRCNADALLRTLDMYTASATILESYDVPFSIQWEEAVSRFRGDIFLWCMGDAYPFFDPEPMFDSMLAMYERGDVGSYAPNLDWTPMTYDIFRLPMVKGGIYEVPGTDLVFASLRKDLLEALPPLGSNTHGWAYDYLIASIARKMELKVVRDYNFLMDHPKGKSYDEQQAWEQQEAWIKTLAPAHQQGIKDMQCLKSLQS